MNLKKLLVVIALFLLLANIFVFFYSQNITENYKQKLLLKFNKSTETFIDKQKQANNKLVLEDLNIVSSIKPKTIEEGVALNLAVFYISTTDFLAETSLGQDLNTVLFEDFKRENKIHIESIKNTGFLTGIEINQKKISLNLQKYLELIVESSKKKLKQNNLSLKEKQKISKKIILIKTLLTGPEYLNRLIENQLKELTKK